MNGTTRRQVFDTISSPLFSLQRHKNSIGESRYNHDDNEGHGKNESEHNRYDKRRHNICSTYRQKFVIRWNIFDLWFKLALIAAILLFLVIVSIRVWDKFFFQVGGLEERHHLSPPSSFAVIINTFRRPKRLQQTVRHYAETCGKQYNVGQVFVVWADPETDPPPSEDFFFDDSKSFFSLRGITYRPNINNRINVEILLKSKDSLNARFEPIPQLRTTSIFMVDDDIRVACSSLEVAFEAWKKYPESMVGYYPRLAAAPKTKYTASVSQREYHSWPMVYWRQKFNIILTKASFLHSRYLELYTNDETFPKQIKDYIDQQRNCEDIAMSMLVANYTKHNNVKTNNNDVNGSISTATARSALPVRPIYVEGDVSDVGLFGGISSGTGHFATRSECLTQLTDLFRSKGWESPLDDQFELVPNSWIKHSPGLWWQYGPSNFFEWLVLPL